jgi:hypothetical protein
VARSRAIMAFANTPFAVTEIGSPGHRRSVTIAGARAGHPLKEPAQSLPAAEPQFYFSSAASQPPLKSAGIVLACAVVLVPRSFSLTTSLSVTIKVFTPDDR